MQKVVLNNDVEMPVLGFGVFQVTDLAECERSVVCLLYTSRRMEEIIAAVSDAVSRWQNIAQGLGISKAEIEDMRDAFKQ